MEIALPNGRPMVDAAVDAPVLARLIQVPDRGMIVFPAGVRLRSACGVTDMRVASGFSNRWRNHWRP